MAKSAHFRHMMCGAVEIVEIRAYPYTKERVEKDDVSR
jgi:hypothetical protein